MGANRQGNACPSGFRDLECSVQLVCCYPQVFDALFSLQLSCGGPLLFEWCGPAFGSFSSLNYQKRANGYKNNYYLEHSAVGRIHTKRKDFTHANRP